MPLFLRAAQRLGLTNQVVLGLLPSGTLPILLDGPPLRNDCVPHSGASHLRSEFRVISFRPVSLPLPVLSATRYLQPLREGGSLPAVVDTDGGGLYVVKFRGAGQGAKPLVSEIIVALLATELGLPVPELALVDISPEFGRSEPDPEIQDLLRASHGLNVALRYLDGAFNFERSAAGELVSTEFATTLVWLDALVTNPDRTPRNPNLLVWRRQPWLIDNGAALYAHYDWASVDEARSRSPFRQIKDHVLLDRAEGLAEADEKLAARVDDDRVAAVLDAVPDTLLLDRDAAKEFASGDDARRRYREYLATRLRAPRAFVDEAIAAREQRAAEPPRRISARR